MGVGLHKEGPGPADSTSEAWLTLGSPAPGPGCVRPQQKTGSPYEHEQEQVQLVQRCPFYAAAGLKWQADAALRHHTQRM